MKQPTTYLGNKQLHSKHSVLVEGGSVPRAKVRDQHVVDRYLMLGLITLPQHRAAEYLLGQAATTGIWPTGVDLSRTRVQSGRPNNAPFRVFPYGRTIATVRKRFGDFHAYLVQEVVCFDWDIRAKDDLMGYLRESLDWIAERRMNHVPLGAGDSRRRALIGTRHPRFPVVAVLGGALSLLDATTGLMAPLEAPFPAEAALAALVSGDRLLVGTSGFGLWAAELRAPEVEVGAAGAQPAASEASIRR